MKKDTIFGWIRIIAGLFIFAFGVHLTIFANIGLAPWDCLGRGLSYHTPLNYGLSMTLIAVTVLGTDLLLKEKIGYGTIIDALLTGNFVQLFNSINPLSLNNNRWLGIGIMLVGFVFMALGMAVYMKKNYMLERLLERISRSEYSDKFIIKGGFLLSSIVGLSTRATMDLDTTIKGFMLKMQKNTRIRDESVKWDKINSKIIKMATLE